MACGAAGFIGSTLVRQALDRGDRVTVLDALTYAGREDNLPVDPRLRFVRGDICDEAIAERLAAEADVIVNLAAETHVDRSIGDADAFLRANVMGTRVLLDAARARGVPLVQVSTDEVYGSVRQGLSGECDPVRPSSPYAVSKAAADLLALAYARTHRVDVRITRGSNTYGPRQHPEKLVPLAITSALTGRRVPIYGDGQQRRSWLWVGDHAAAILRVLDRGRPGAVYNVPGEEMTNRLVVADLVRAAGASEALLVEVPDRPGHDARYAVDGRRLARLGWRRQVGWPEGRDRTVRWYRAHPERWDGFFAEPYYAAQYPALAT